MKTLFFSLGVVIFLIFPRHIYAEYVMPYPAVMPGNKLYSLSEGLDRVKGWWSFGNLAQFSYQLKMADKKLIEAKTLFEYKQYLLASYAIPQYESHMQLAKSSLSQAKNEGKDTSNKEKILAQAISQHDRILEKIMQETPDTFLWQPEKKPSQLIEIHKLIKSAMQSSK